MAVRVSLRRMANTVLVVVGAFLIGGVLHRAFVTGEGELLAPSPVARIVLGIGVLLVAYFVRVPRGEWRSAGESGDDTE